MNMRPILMGPTACSISSSPESEQSRVGTERWCVTSRLGTAFLLAEQFSRRCRIVRHSGAQEGETILMGGVPNICYTVLEPVCWNRLVRSMSNENQTTALVAYANLLLVLSLQYDY